MILLINDSPLANETVNDHYLFSSFALALSPVSFVCRFATITRKDAAFLGMHAGTIILKSKYSCK